MRKSAERATLRRSRVSLPGKTGNSCVRATRGQETSATAL